MRVKRWGIGAILGVMSATGLAAEPAPLKFERTVIDANFPGGYQVEVADVNGDGKPDVVALGGSTLAWYENPTWTKRVVSTSKQTPDIISSATADLDGDGKAEIAIAYDFAMNEPKRGKLLLAIQGAKPDDPWTFRPVVDLPSIHRLRWGDVDGDGKPELVVAPIFGPKARGPAFDQDPATLRAFFLDDDPKAGRWAEKALAERAILHAIEVRPSTDPADRRATIYTADRRGVARVQWPLPGVKGFSVELTPTPLLSSSSFGPAPKRGSSEVHLGHLQPGVLGEFLATIDPWHGSEVVVHQIPSNSLATGLTRTVIDATLDDGHALWVADVDGDGLDEIFAGHRGKDHRVSVYRNDPRTRIDRDSSTTWTRTVLDTEIAAQDLRGGDIDGDGTPDVVAIGGKTHNVVWYRPIRPAK